MAHAYWLTGLSGAGKSSIARELSSLLRGEGRAVALLDGDAMREVLGETAAYSRVARLRLAASYGRLARLLTDQGIDVVCATISMFREVYEWNRANVRGYREIWVRASMETLAARDRRGLYHGEVPNVVGVDIPFDEPVAVDLVLDTDRGTDPKHLADRILRELG